MRAIAIIPARLASTRLVRKVLREIAGRPMLAHVYEAVRSSPLLSDVIIAADSEEVMALCRKNNWNARLTSPSHTSGTARVHEISCSDIANPNVVKVVTDVSGRALYFSRATIPYDRDRSARPQYFKHLGFYGYRKPALDRFCSLPESALERAERLEQLRFLENGIAIYVAETRFDTVGVDTEEDCKRVEEILRRKS